MRSAKDIMSSAVISVKPNCSLSDAFEIIVANSASELPVIDDAGHLVGVLTEADRLNLLIENAPPRDEACVADYMSCNVISVEADASLTGIADLLMRGNVRRVPVVSDGTIVGIISRRDLMRAIHEESTETSTV